MSQAENIKVEELLNMSYEEAGKILGFEFMHVGINCSNAEQAEDVAGRFDELFGLTKKVGNSSVFAGTVIEVMKKPFLGKHGHIAIATDYIEKAVEYLEKKGVSFNQESAKYVNERLKTIYLQDEIGEFAVHLVQR